MSSESNHEFGIQDIEALFRTQIRQYMSTNWALALASAFGVLLFIAGLPQINSGGISGVGGGVIALSVPVLIARLSRAHTMKRLYKHSRLQSMTAITVDKLAPNKNPSNIASAPCFLITEDRDRYWLPARRTERPEVNATALTYFYGERGHDLMILDGFKKLRFAVSLEKSASWWNLNAREAFSWSKDIQKGPGKDVFARQFEQKP